MAPNSNILHCKAIETGVGKVFSHKPLTGLEEEALKDSRRATKKCMKMCPVAITQYMDFRMIPRT